VTEAAGRCGRGSLHRFMCSHSCSGKAVSARAARRTPRPSARTLREPVAQSVDILIILDDNIFRVISIGYGVQQGVHRPNTFRLKSAATPYNSRRAAWGWSHECRRRRVEIPMSTAVVAAIGPLPAARTVAGAAPVSASAPIIAALNVDTPRSKSEPSRSVLVGQQLLDVDRDGVRRATFGTGWTTGLFDQGFGYCLCQKSESAAPPAIRWVRYPIEGVR
jgi:hypothetical protein